MMGIPRPLILIGGVLATLLVLPPFIIGWIRSAPSSGRQIHLFFDMDMQPKFKPQSPSKLFADTRSMRPLVPETVAVGEANLDPHMVEGVGANGEWALNAPASLNTDLSFLKRGHERFDIYCSVCHGYAGFGDGMVNRRGMALLGNADGPPDGTKWVAAKSLHDETVRPQPIGQIYHTITHGIRNMAGYASQIPTEDRWAIAAYVKALQLSQNASKQDVPPDQRANLRTASGIPAKSEAGATPDAKSGAKP
ncbi:MAG: cytochrome c [Phycisphaerae bacterium]|nr:cytochrome c [Phycisphaerae bacterium]